VSALEHDGPVFYRGHDEIQRQKLANDATRRTLAEILKIAEDSNARPEWVGSGVLMRCPTHADRSPSLKVDEGPEGLLMHCHAGCADDGPDWIRTLSQWFADPVWMADPDWGHDRDGKRLGGARKGGSRKGSHWWDDVPAMWDYTETRHRYVDAEDNLLVAKLRHRISQDGSKGMVWASPVKPMRSEDLPGA
jgi:hypothetical protein